MLERQVNRRIKLRMLQPTDAIELFSVVERNRDYLRQWLPWLDRNSSVEDTLDFIESTLNQFASGRGLVCAVRWDGDIVGVTGFHPIDRLNRSVELGYWLAEQYTGLGIMTRSCRTLVDYAFDALALNRVVIRVAAENRRSQAVAERLGFRREGVLREAEWLYDRYVDLVVFAALNREWSARHAGENAGR